MNSLVISESSGPSFVIDTRSRFYGVCTRDRDILKYMQVYTWPRETWIRELRIRVEDCICVPTHFYYACLLWRTCFNPQNPQMCYTWIIFNGGFDEMCSHSSNIETEKEKEKTTCSFVVSGVQFRSMEFNLACLNTTKDFISKRIMDLFDLRKTFWLFLIDMNFIFVAHWVFNEDLVLRWFSTVKKCREIISTSANIIFTQEIMRKMQNLVISL